MYFCDPTKKAYFSVFSRVLFTAVGLLIFPVKSSLSVGIKTKIHRKQLTYMCSEETISIQHSWQIQKTMVISLVHNFHPQQGKYTLMGYFAFSSVAEQRLDHKIPRLMYT